MCGALGRTGGPCPCPAPHWPPPRREGPPALRAPGVAAPQGNRRLPGADAGRERHPEGRPGAAVEFPEACPVLPAAPPRAMLGCPCSVFASRKLCPEKSSTLLTARRGAWWAARPQGPRSPARDCGGPQAPGARRDPPCASGRQDALRGPLGEPGFVGEPNFALHLHLRLRLGDLAATDLVWQELHQEVRKSERGSGCAEPAGESPGGGRSIRLGVPGVSDRGSEFSLEHRRVRFGSPRSKRISTPS